MTLNNAGNISDAGFVANVGNGFASRNLIAGTGVTITNGDGQTGNPTINVPSTTGTTDWTLIEETTISGAVANVDFTNPEIETANEILFVLENVEMTGTNDLAIRFSDDGFSTFESFIMARGDDAFGLSNSFMMIDPPDSTTRFVNGYLYLESHNLHDRSIGDWYCADVNSAVVVEENGSFISDTAVNYTGVRLTTFANNNILSGVISLYVR